MRIAIPLDSDRDHPTLTPGSPAGDIVADLDAIAAAAMVYRLAYSSTTAYNPNDVVLSGGAMWVAIASSTNVTPGTDGGTVWQPFRVLVGTTTGTVAAGDDARFAGSPAGTAGAALAATASIPETQITGLGTAAVQPDTAYEHAANKGAAGGYAALDGGGKVPSAQLPALSFNTVWPNVVSQAAMLALAAEPGDLAVRTDIAANFMLAALPASTLGNWAQLADATSPVTSVAGRTGAVALANTDIAGLGSAATHPATDFDAAGAAASAQAASEPLGRAQSRALVMSLIFGA